jgi:hypothetical protein
MLVLYPAMQWLLLAGSASLLVLIGCSGGGSGMGAGSMPTSPPTTALTADFESIQANIFTPICAGCHSGSNPPANLSLDAAHSYNDLVNVPSTEEPTLDRVKPGDPTDSFLVIHLQKDGDGAPAGDIPFVIQWIMDGALPGNSAMPMEAEFRVGAVEPNFGDALHSSPVRIIIGFTQELDTAGIVPGAVRLERIDDNADAPIAAITVPTRITVPTSASIPAHNARALILTPATALRPGQYQVVLSMDSGVAVRSLTGASLSDSNSDDNRERIATRFSVAQ